MEDSVIMVTKQFHTPTGIVTRELTPQEIIDFAKRGDEECMTELFKQKYQLATTIDQKLDLISKLLLRIIG